MSKLSVIVPVYNREKYIGKCIDSLVNQTLDDIEIILVDDGSQDKSLDIITAYQEKYPKKIRIIESKQNAGAAHARNLGLDIATGEYIGFVDSDDYVATDLYEKMVSTCEETYSQIARTNRKIVCGKLDLSFLGRNCIYETIKLIKPKEDKHYLISEPPCATNKIFTRKLIGDAKFPVGLKWEDYPFAFPLMLNANQVATIPGKNYFYNLHLNSTTCTDVVKLNKNLLDIFTCSDMVGETCLTQDIDDNVRYKVNYVQIQNCVQRLKEIANANIPIQGKRELLTLVSELIKVKYGNWQEHELYLEQKETSFVHNIRTSLVEGLLLPNDNYPKTESELKEKIRIKLNQHTKK